MNRASALRNRRCRRWQGWPRALLAAIVWLPLLGGCGPQRSTGPVGSTGELPDQEVRNFVLTETDQGNPVWKLYARYAAMYDARNSIVAQGVRVEIGRASCRERREVQRVAA